MSDTPNTDSRVALARDRTTLAKFRTSLALDRTTLAWIRTNLTMGTYDTAQFVLKKYATRASAEEKKAVESLLSYLLIFAQPN
jgi:uncharacterized membrane protein YidH (DUF202 family)